MTMAQDREVAVWLENGVPARIVWEGRRYHVSDTPTPLADLLYELTHPPRIVGWRFQGSPDEGGETLVFDIVQQRSGWHIARVFS